MTRMARRRPGRGAAAGEALALTGGALDHGAGAPAAGNAPRRDVSIEADEPAAFVEPQEVERFQARVQVHAGAGRSPSAALEVGARRWISDATE